MQKEIEEMIESIEAKKSYLVQNGTLILDPLLESNKFYAIKFNDDVNLISKKGRPITIKKDSIKLVRSFTKDYETEITDILINIEDALTDGKYLYDNRAELNSRNKNISIYEVQEYLKTLMVITPNSIDLVSIVNADKYIGDLFESLRKTLSIRPSIQEQKILDENAIEINSKLDENTFEINSKLDEIRNELNSFNNNIINTNKIDLSEIALIIKAKDESTRIIDIESMFITDNSTPPFIKNLLDVNEYRKANGIMVKSFEIIEIIISNVLDYKIRFSSAKINKILNALEIDELKDYIDTLLK